MSRASIIVLLKLEEEEPELESRADPNGTDNSNRTTRCEVDGSTLESLFEDEDIGTVRVRLVSREEY